VESIFLALKALGTLGAIASAVISFVWLLRKFERTGYLRGVEKGDKKCEEKIQSLYARLSSNSDPGFRVRNPEVRWGLPSADSGLRVEPRDKDENRGEGTSS
jgi:hypothetical protein